MAVSTRCPASGYGRGRPRDFPHTDRSIPTWCPPDRVSFSRRQAKQKAPTETMNRQLTCPGVAGYGRSGERVESRFSRPRHVRSTVRTRYPHRRGERSAAPLEVLLQRGSPPQAWGPTLTATGVPLSPRHLMGVRSTWHCVGASNQVRATPHEREEYRQSSSLRWKAVGHPHSVRSNRGRPCG
jgi:hypothetical protein